MGLTRTPCRRFACSSRGKDSVPISPASGIPSLATRSWLRLEKRSSSGFPGLKICMGTRSWISLDSLSNRNSVAERNDRRIVPLVSVKHFVERPHSFRVAVLDGFVCDTAGPQHVIGNQQTAYSNPACRFSKHFRVIVLVDVIEDHVEVALHLIDQVE